MCVRTSKFTGMQVNNQQAFSPEVRMSVCVLAPRIPTWQGSAFVLGRSCKTAEPIQCHGCLTMRLKGRSCSGCGTGDAGQAMCVCVHVTRGLLRWVRCTHGLQCAVSHTCACVRTYVRRYVLSCSYVRTCLRVCSAHVTSHHSACWFVTGGHGTSRSVSGLHWARL